MEVTSDENKFTRDDLIRFRHAVERVERFCERVVERGFDLHEDFQHASKESLIHLADAAKEMTTEAAADEMSPLAWLRVTLEEIERAGRTGYARPL